MIDLQIKGFIPNTMLDWEGMLASTIFLPGCNFRCPFCQNPDLVLHPERLETVPLAEVKDYLREREGWVEGVCITGGEPCLHQGLPELCAELKAEGVGVKLDTNGSVPDMLQRVIDDGLVDYVSMDIKAPLEPRPYKVATGVDRPEMLEAVFSSIHLIRASRLGHEFRTTVVPMMHGPAEVARIAEFLQGEERFVLQHFSPRDTLDPRFASLRPFTEEDMETMLAAASRFVPGTVVRGAPDAFQG
ncbi:MAG TPA: anaerobic ribonucleoside-triphosphate reductase activating protein [Candidatus Anoxymicrobiaceae bacterium]